jgi:hypothetical protein
MPDRQDSKPTMPLEPPAHDHEAREAYDQELFEYYKKLRAWKMRQADHQTPDHTTDNVTPFAQEFFRVGVLNKPVQPHDVVIAEAFKATEPDNTDTYLFGLCIKTEEGTAVFWMDETAFPVRTVGVVVTVAPEKPKGKGKGEGYAA